MAKTLLIDGDIFIYRAALSSQVATDFGDDQWALTADLPTAKQHLDAALDEIFAKLKADKMVIAISDKENFRKEILPAYKSNRKGVQRPLLLSPLRDYAHQTRHCYQRPTLEADDVLGILATNPKLIGGEKIIVSTDKDLRTIPGRLFDPDKMDELETITKPQADYSFHIQILTGDKADGYDGCPQVGAIKAARILADSPPQDYWPRIVEAYVAAGLDEEAALTTARVARILRHEDYNYKEKRPCLWQPN